MDKEQFSADWKNLKGKVKEKWGELTDDEIMRIDGKRDQLLSLLQEKYDYEKDYAENELSQWEEEFNADREEDTIYPHLHQSEKR